MISKKHKLILINPVELHSQGFKSIAATRYPPLGLAYIAALTPSDWEAKLIDENFEDFEFQSADLIGIGSFTASINRAYEIASIYRKHKIPVVLGGIHASMLPDEALQYVDTVVRGEAESVWGEVLSDFKEGKLKNIYCGERLPLNNLVMPRRDLLNTNYKMATIQTSRGCPMNCEFCSVTSFNGQQFRQRPVEAVLDELELIKQKTVFFVDDNILGYGEKTKERALRLFKGIIDRKIRKYWWAQSTLDLANHEDLLKYAARSGCKAVFVGIESLEKATLKLIDKSVNLRLGIENYDSLFKKFHKYGIAVWGALMVGNDTDDSGIFTKTANFILNSGIDIVQITFSTPLPGTRLYDRLSQENRIELNNYPKDWKYYYFQHLAYKPKILSVEEAYKGMRYLKKKVYSSSVLKKKFLKTLLTTKNFVSSIFAYRINKAYQQLFYSYDYFKKY